MMKYTIYKQKDRIDDKIFNTFSGLFVNKKCP